MVLSRLAHLVRNLRTRPANQAQTDRRKFLRGIRPHARHLHLETLERREVLTHGFFQGFEINDDGWDVGGGTFNAARVATGNNGVTSLTGSFHAEAAPPSNTIPFTRYGAYSSVFPTGGFTNSIAIYLDISGGGYANDTRFDFTSAINTPAGAHRRDFAFNGGFYNSADVTGPGAGSDRFVFSASNNTGGSAFPKNPARSPIAITVEGWYTFQHRFYDGGGGQLAVDLTIKNSAGVTMGTWTLTDVSDIIGGTVGGNRYGWFASNGFPFLAFDDSYQLNNGPPAVTYVDDSWAGVPFGSDPDGGGPATFMGYDAFVTVQGGVNGVASGGTVNVHAGTYSENLLLNKPLTLRGNNAGVAGDGARAAKSQIVTNGNQTAVITVTSSNVTIDGFNIDGDDTLVAGNVMASGEDTNVLYGVLENAVVSNLIVQNNIIEHAFIGVRGDGASTGNVISQNWFDSIGRYDFGYAVTMRGDFYADITDNLMTRVWTGVHTNSHYAAGGPASWTMSGNEVHSYAAGLWYNNTGSAATGLTVDNNDFVAEATAVANNMGIFVTSVGSAISSSFTNNTVTGADYGAVIWNDTTTSTVTLGGTNSIVNPDIAGVLLTNNLASSPIGSTVFGAGGATALNLVGLPITGVVATGIRVDAVGGSATTLNIGSGVSISGGVTGLNVNGSAAVIGGNTLSDSSFTGQTGNYIQFGAGTLDNVEINATAALFDGTTGGAKTNLANYNAENKILHGVDDSARGFVRLKAGNLFTTPASFVAPALAADVQDAIDVASNGNTLNIQGGSYTGSANVSSVDLLVSLGESPAQVVINGNVSLDGGDTLVMELNGLTAGTQYDQLVVNGTVSLGNLVDGFASLSPTAGFAYPALSYVTLIANDGAGVGADLTAGHFDGQLDGSTINIGGQTFVVFHNGGDGNDVILVKALPGITPTVVYAEDADWTNFTLGTFIPDGDLSPLVGGPAFIGYNAFNNRPLTLPNSVTPIQDAVNAVITNGTGRVIVNEGSYPENVSLVFPVTLEGRLVDAGNATINPAVGVGLTINSASFVTVRDINIAAATALNVAMTTTVNLENLNTAGSAAGGSITDVDNLNVRTRDNLADSVDVNFTTSGQFSSTELDPTTFSLITNFTVQTRGVPDTISAKPTLAGQAMNLRIEGGTPPPAPIAVPNGDVAGDKLILDMSDTTGPVIVSTVTGLASSASHRPLTFIEIEDIDLIDDNLPTDVQMGDLYLRGTAGQDIFQFTQTQAGAPNVSAALLRVRVNSQFHNLLVSRRIIGYGRAGNDYLQNTNVPLPVEFYGEGDHDYITGYSGNDLLVGGGGNDRLLAGEGANILWGDDIGAETQLDGADQLSSGSGVDTGYGGGGNDTITLGGGDDYAFGGSGNDSIDGLSGNDRLYGGDGDDVMSGHDGNDLVAGGNGNDRLYGKTGHDVLLGGDGADQLNGEDGNDLLFQAGATYNGQNESSTVRNDLNDAAMQALLTDWIANAVNGSLAAGGDDGDIDYLSGGAGLDKAYRKQTGPTADTLLETETDINTP